MCSILHCFSKKYIPLDILLLQISNTFLYKDFMILITTVIASLKIYLLILS